MNFRSPLNIFPGTANGDLARTRAMTLIGKKCYTLSRNIRPLVSKGKDRGMWKKYQLYSYNNLITFQCLLRLSLTSSVCMMYR